MAKSRRVDYPMRSCLSCGKEFKPGNKRALWCSKLCRDRYKTGRSTLEEHLAKVRAEARGRKESVCLHCGKSFVAKAGGTALKQSPDKWGKYCSKQCRVEYKRLHPDKRVCDYSPVYFAQCKVCGKWFRKRGPSAICSDVCRRRSYIAYIDKKRVSSRTIQCVICGVEFSRLYKNDKTVCSDKCGVEQQKNIRRDHRHKRRAAIHSAGYERFNAEEIFARDRWKCNACGVKTPKARRGTTHPNAPELDHILPISVGGSHTRQNTQLLCRQCNSTKGNGSLQDQLRLL